MTARRIWLGCLLGLPFAASAQVDVPNSFAAGEPAVADDVNANFESLADALSEIADSVDDSDARLTSVESDVANLPSDVSALRMRVAEVATAALAVVDADGSVVGPLLGDVLPARVLIEIDDVQVSVGAVPTGLASDPFLHAVSEVTSDPVHPEAEIGFTGIDCAGDAYYFGSAAQTPPKLVELGIVVGDRVLARDATLGLPLGPAELVPFTAQSYYTVAGNPEAPAMTCQNGALSASGVPAVSRVLQPAAPLTVRTP